MERISKEETKAALNAKAWNEQKQFIEHVEELLMEEDDIITTNEIQVCFDVLSKYVSDDNKNLVQRSMKIIEALSQCIKESDTITNISPVFKSVFQCLNDPRPNIREQSMKTINSLCVISKFSYFTQFTSELAGSFIIEGKQDVLQMLQTHQEEIAEFEWSQIFTFIIQCFEDKSPSIRSRTQELAKCELFLQLLQKNFDKLTVSQKKLLQNLIDKRSSQSKFDIETKKSNSTEELTQHSPTTKKKVIDLNTSAFSRKQRQSELKDTDGLFLITDVSSFVPFMHRLSLDVRDVFDDEVSDLLLSQQSSIRVTAVDHLRNIFDSSMKNFENSVDIILRWCVIQFLSWQLNVSQVSLNLLIEEFKQCSEKFKLTSKEVHIIVPIVLWCTATESEAFRFLLQQIRQLSSEKDFNETLLMSLQLDHVTVITCIFDELKNSKEIESIEGQLKELCVEGTYMVRTECKKLLQRLAPMSPRKAQSMRDIVSRLQYYITQIKANPEEVTDCNAIFGYILDAIERKPTDKREIRYLLYCTHSFLSEPYLTESINKEDFTTLISALCEFSIDCPHEFFDALLSIGFVIVSIHTSVSLFEAIIDFIRRNIETQNQRSFSSKVFNLGIQLIEINKSSSDLLQLRTFAKSVLSQYSSKDDLRAILCRLLLSSILHIETQKKDADTYRSVEEFSGLRQNSINNFSEMSNQNNTSYAANSSDELFELIKILQRINRQETRNEACRELIAFDERFPGEKIIETIGGLSPLLKKHIEGIRNRTTNSRPSSRTSNRGEDDSNELNRSFGASRGGVGSRPSSRSSATRQPSVGHDNSRSGHKSSHGSSRPTSSHSSRK